MLKIKKAAPTKKTLNLMIIESSAARFRRVLPAVILGAVAIALFGKLAVADRLMAASRIEQEALDAEIRLEQMEKELENYDAVAAEYSRYFSDGLGSGRDIIPVDCMEALKIVDEYVMDRLAVSSIDFYGDTITLLFTGDELARAADLMPRLEALPQVAEVTLSTADSKAAMTEGQGVYMQLSITFQEVSE